MRAQRDNRSQGRQRSQWAYAGMFLAGEREGGLCTQIEAGDGHARGVNAAKDTFHRNCTAGDVLQHEIDAPYARAQRICIELLARHAGEIAAAAGRG
jgi:hypothetical protein